VTSFGQTPVVAFNRFSTDTPEEMAIVKQFCQEAGVRMAVNEAFEKGGSGAEELARCVIDATENNPSKPIVFTYDDQETIVEKIKKVAINIYGAREVVFTDKATKELKKIAGTHLEKFPVCIAKTQYSFSADPTAYGAPTNFPFEISDIVINQGAEFIVAIAGKIMRMPGLPADPQARRIDLVNGEITGLS
jgi:formate--tetrahydrofolate ligase